MRNTLTMACVLGIACTAATATALASTHAVITRAGSRENITHLAPGLRSGSMPGGANAARFLDVTAAAFKADGKTPAPGERIRIVAFDRDGTTKKAVELAAVDAITDSLGMATVRLPIGECRGPGIVGPLSVHRRSNKPAYWDITYVPGATVTATTADDRQPPEGANFQHVCRERFRGNQP
ncbi:hypothetical protein [Luteibacter sp. ME-Dv--P-043b]|uniref:hypothetical protein n=1 Tax=Luteibacter sp. ME-Dv--P-043b TaxID=3040291 RepID=UPI0025531D63|nr:hypothetical protein [Luteibacter sp. ME-Dv--P-043b]